MKNIILFNLADTSGAEVRNAAANLGQRARTYRVGWQGMNIKVYDLFELFLDPERTTIPLHQGDGRIDVAIDTVRRECRGADKIVVSSHGPYTDTTFSVLRDPANRTVGAIAMPAIPNVAGVAVQVTLARAAEVVAAVLDPGHENYIALLICYAARSGTYRPNQFTTGGDPTNWADSYACKLFALLCENRSAALTMSARTAQHGFSRTTGLSEVQTEEAVAAEITYAEEAGDDLNDWIEATRLRAFDVGAAVRAPATLAFAQDFFGAAAVLQPPQKLTALRSRLAGPLATDLPAEDRARFVAFARRMELDIGRRDIASHYGKIYYSFSPRRQEIKIKHARVTSTLKRRVKDDLQTIDLVSALALARP